MRAEVADKDGSRSVGAPTLIDATGATDVRQVRTLCAKPHDVRQRY